MLEAFGDRVVGTIATRHYCGRMGHFHIQLEIHEEGSQCDQAEDATLVAAVVRHRIFGYGTWWNLGLRSNPCAAEARYYRPGFGCEGSELVIPRRAPRRVSPRQAGGRDPGPQEFQGP